MRGSRLFSGPYWGAEGAFDITTATFEPHYCQVTIGGGVAWKGPLLPVDRGLTVGATTYNVLSDQFGVDPSGATFSTAAVQAAIDAVCATGGDLVFPPSLLKCGNLTISNATKVTLQGKGGQINWAGTAAAIGFQYVGTLLDLTIAGMILNGDGVLANGHSGIWGNSGQSLTNIKVLRNRITNVVLGISLNADTGGLITGGLVEGNDLDNMVGTVSGSGYGIHHANGSGNGSGVRIVNNIISRAHRHSIYQAKGSGAVISGNVSRLHRTGDALAGSPLSAIVCSRTTDTVIANNIVDTPNDSAIEISPDVGFASGGITYANNIAFGFVNTGGVTGLIGSSNPAAAGVTDGVRIVNNLFEVPAPSTALFTIYSGKRLQFLGNAFVYLGVTGGEVACFYLRADGETAGTATYSDEWMFKENYLYGTEAGGALYGWEWKGTAAASGIRADFINNRVNVPHGAHVFDGAQANSLVVRSIGTDITGLGVGQFTTPDADGAITSTIAPGAGGAGALPATPAGYYRKNINGTVWHIPYY